MIKKRPSQAKAWPKVNKGCLPKTRNPLSEAGEWIDKARWVHYQGKAGTLPTRVSDL